MSSMSSCSVSAPSFLPSLSAGLREGTHQACQGHTGAAKGRMEAKPAHGEEDGGKTEKGPWRKGARFLRCRTTRAAWRLRGAPDPLSSLTVKVGLIEPCFHSLSNIKIHRNGTPALHLKYNQRSELFTENPMN